jgi:hypothetical protein
MLNVAPETVLRAVRSARMENRSIRSVARDFGIPFRSLTRYCSRAFGDIRGISQNPTFSIEYEKTRPLISSVFLLYGESEQGNKPKVSRSFIFAKWIIT